MALKPSILHQFRLSVHERQLGIYAVRVFQQGQGEVSAFFRSDDKVCLYSGSKTFTALGVGICRDQGRLHLNDTVLSFFPEFKAPASPGSEKITVRDLLHMASGKKEFWFAGPPERMRNADWAELFFADPMKGTPGGEFFYSNACTYMLSRIVEKVTAKKLRDFLVPVLFDPMGIDNPQWHTCPRGHTLGATELYLTNAEYARLGELLLGWGEFRGQRVVNEAWVNESVADVIDSGPGPDAEGASGYGYQLWRCSYPGAYRADGLYGQFSIVFPDLGAVVTVTAHEEKRANDILRTVYQDIVPYLISP
jgi:CubicO group peptidase (beta-lactamase class C family)